jgi:hypothetical protein
VSGRASLPRHCPLRERCTTVLSSRLAFHLSEQLARAGLQPGRGGPRVEANDVQAIQQLTEPIRGVVLGAFTSALDEVFLVGVPFTLAAVGVALLLKEEPLRTGPGAPGAPGIGGSCWIEFRPPGQGWPRG